MAQSCVKGLWVSLTYIQVVNLRAQLWCAKSIPLFAPFEAT